MNNKTSEQRAKEAEAATFYFDGNDTYRMNWVLEDSFCIENEDTGEEYVIKYEKIPAKAYFLKLVRIE
jgi:hypothetical protein